LGIVTLAEDLADQEEAFQDFVIAHELLHLRVPNHGKLFKALMTAYIPDWERHGAAAARSGPFPKRGAQTRGESAGATNS